MTLNATDGTRPSSYAHNQAFYGFLAQYTSKRFVGQTLTKCRSALDCAAQCS
uniref:Uncharacterized protein n=1 Tax=Rhizophora mucronata TaxID=61149 RepID=A0A2P2N218_RHIMU